MANKRVFNTAISTIVLGAALVSCSAVGGAKPASLSAGAEKALEKGNPEKALAKAEQAVALDPRNAELRLLLADAYLANGRMTSAEQSFADALALGDTSNRAVISMAMMHAANGEAAKAQQLLTAHRDAIPAADYGLAVAVSGDTKTGVNMLVDDIRGGNNTAKVRQNLAFAYALDGRWREAQIMVAQDLSPEVAQQRITEWTKISHPDAYRARIVSVLGIQPVADSGQPAQLALANTPSMMAMVEDVVQNIPMAVAGAQSFAPLPAMAQAISAPQAPLIAANPQPVKTVPVAPKRDFIIEGAGAKRAATAPIAPAPKPATQAATKMASAPSGSPVMVSKAMVQPLPAGYQMAKPDAKPVAAAPVRMASNAPVSASILRQALDSSAAKPAVKFVPVARGPFAVQLGVFSSAGNTDRAWQHYTSKHSALAAFTRSNAPHSAQGKQLTRLLANGFADEKTARAMCAQVRRSGDACIISRAKY